MCLISEYLFIWFVFVCLLLILSTKGTMFTRELLNVTFIKIICVHGSPDTVFPSGSTWCHCLVVLLQSKGPSAEFSVLLCSEALALWSTRD